MDWASVGLISSIIAAASVYAMVDRTLTTQKSYCRLTDKFAEKGIYASEEENGEYMCQLSPNNPLWGHHNIDTAGELKKWETSSKKQHFCQQSGE